jgi:hypothetical protein
VSLRGEYQTVTAGANSPLWVAGVVIRYGFYAIGAVVLAMVGIGLLSLWRIAPKPVDAPPAFHIAASGVANKRSAGMSLPAQGSAASKSANTVSSTTGRPISQWSW